MKARVISRVIPALARGAAGSALLLALAGCQKSASKEEAPAAPPSAAPAASAAPAPTASAAAAATTSDIPTPEDFEQVALDEINPQNLEAQIDKLEKEIGK